MAAFLLSHTGLTFTILSVLLLVVLTPTLLVLRVPANVTLDYRTG